jgi:hypothetical protein
MTREEALEIGIRLAVKYLGEIVEMDPERAATNLIEANYGFCGELSTPDELEGFAVGLQLIAVEVADIARKRREAVEPREAACVECGTPSFQSVCSPCVDAGDAAETSEVPESTAQGAAVPEIEAFTYERVEVAGPAGDPIWTYERRPMRTG